MDMYDVVVVGAGMIGSAAARHLAEDTNLRVLLIGPSEPQNRETTDIFGAHYDEGRIYRIMDPNPIWGLLAKNSIARYPNIEKRSGIKFSDEVGFLAVGPKYGDYMKALETTTSQLNAKIETFEASSLKNKYSYLRFDTYNRCILTSQDAGHISPRRLVQAQKILARRAGCDIIDDVASDIVSRDLPFRHFVITSDNEQVVHAKRVLLATGAFTSCRQLLPTYLEPQIVLLTQTFVKVRISQEQARQYSNMPCIVVKEAIPSNSSPNGYCDSSKNFGFYILSPIKYPDGNYYVKIGHGDEDAIQLHNPRDIRNWFRSFGDKNSADYVYDMLQQFLPEMEVLDKVMDNCVTAHTPTDLPYIDMVTPEMGVAIGGCGYSAKSSDEIGNIAARMIAKGQWSYDSLPSSKFRFQSKSPSSKI